MGTVEVRWECLSCKAPPVAETLVVGLVPRYATGVCSALTCKTRKKVKIKLKSGVRGANYADTLGKATFRRIDDDSTNTTPG